jgi:predicted lipoprotein with Yx(FWY)xxD motif
MRNRWWAGPSIAAAVVVLAACGSSTASNSGGTSGGGSAASSGSGGTTATSKSKVVTDAAGFTVYWFAIDTPKKSNCNDSTCVSFWPPLPASAKLTNMSSLPGTFGKITRADGSKQLTYMGHPLYTFKQDTAPGQDKGNGQNLSGGVWWAMTPSGAKLTAAPAPSASSSGGYGY